MLLLEKLFINHHIEIFDDEGVVRIKLTDHSGVGGFVDPSGVVGGELYAPLQDGSCTPCSLKEVMFLLDKLPLSVMVQDLEGESCTIDSSELPKERNQREKLLSLRCRDIWEEEERVSDDENAQPQPWYAAWKKATENKTRSLFTGLPS